MSTGNVELLARAERWRAREALVADGQRYTYVRLLHDSRREAARLRADGRDIEGERVVFLVPPGAAYVVTLLAIWSAGGIAVPLSASQAPAEWDYIIADTQAAVVVGAEPAAAQTLRSIAERRGARYLTASSGRGRARSPSGPDTAASERRRCRSDRPALILYTSGTTSRPKGVVTTHANVEAQISALVEAWRWTEHDRILHVLPLNHVHGLVNVLGCALWAGACCEFLSPFDARATWERFAAGSLTLFMAVPTIYSRLIAAWEEADEATRQRWGRGAGALRLMVSGSAALPVRVLERWREITGHVLLERYGMTEIGMAISNPLDGPRRPGSVGAPLPGVEVRLVDERGRDVEPGTAGEIEVRGPGVFKEYWRRPDATAAAFRDGWFRTGDVAVAGDGSYRILGRSSVDIIKTGGYKVSALEIEEVLREHPVVSECAVVGLPDEQWGERVGAAVATRGGAPLGLDDLRAWAAPRLAKYKLPTRLALVESLPRNAMGKVVKAEVRKRFLGEPEGSRRT